MLQKVQELLTKASIPEELSEQLVAAFMEAKTKFFIGDHRPTAVEGGRFSEVAFRILQWETSTLREYTNLSKSLDPVPKLIAKIENSGHSNDGIRLHIPRALRLIYDIRNKRDNAHVSAGIVSNIQDATLVIRTMEWILAEFVRVFHAATPDEAHNIINGLIVREIPIIQDFNGFPKVLAKLRAGDHLLLLLYQEGSDGTSLAQLREWALPQMRSNIRRTLNSLEENNYVHSADEIYFITVLGRRKVEKEYQNHQALMADLA